MIYIGFKYLFIQSYIKMSISTRDQLKDLIHSIHDYIRNSGAGYGMKAMRTFTLFYGLKLIEPNFNKLGLENFCRFSELVKIANKKGLNSGEIYTAIRKILDSLAKIPNLNTYVYYEIPRDLQDDTYIHIIKEVEKIPINLELDISEEEDEDKLKIYDVDLKGKIYEYFIGRDATAISELGAYYTDRYIINLIMDKVNPTLTKDKKVKTMIDPFGGSGGFTLTYIKYLNEHNEKINWNTELKNVYHFDMELDAIKLAGLEMFALTGEFPILRKNLKRTNTFREEFINDKNENMYFDYIFTNPPYGGDKIVKDSDQIKRDKIISRLKKIIDEYKKDKTKKNILDKRELHLKKLNKESKEWKESKDTKNVSYDTCSKRIKNWIDNYNSKLKKSEELNANDKEACSLILFMDLLADNGTCIGVLKEGLFFDNTYSKIRNKLINNFEITHLISIPSDAFENTTTKTSAIIFKKSRNRTKEIIFSELVVEKELEDIFDDDDDIDEIELLKNKGDVIKVYDRETARATYEELVVPTIIKNSKGEEVERFDYSLDYKKYLKDETFCPEGYELKKLGDYLEFKQKSKRAATFANETGKFKFYTSSDKIKKCDECDFKDDQLKIIFGDGGKGSIFLDDKFSCSDHNIVCINKDEKITRYIYNYIHNNWANFIFRLFNGSVLGNIGREGLSNYQIPIPKDLTKLKPQLDKVQKLHKQISDDTELIPHKEKEICELIKKMTSEGKKGVDYEEKMIGEIAKVLGSPGGEKLGKFYRYEITNNEILNDNYGFIRGADISSEEKKIKYYITNKDYDLYYKNTNTIVSTNDILLTACSSKIKFIKVSEMWEKYPYHGCIRFTDIKININYIFYYMMTDSFTDYILKLQSGSVVKYSNASHFQNTLIQVPTPSTMKKYNLEKLFNEIDQIKERLETTKKEHEKEVNLLMKPFENKTQVKVQIKSEKIIDSDEDTTEEEPQPKKELTKEIKKVVEEEKPKKIATKRLQNKPTEI